MKDDERRRVDNEAFQHCSIDLHINEMINCTVTYNVSQYMKHFKLRYLNLNLLRSMMLSNLLALMT